MQQQQEEQAAKEEEPAESKSKYASEDSPTRIPAEDRHEKESVNEQDEDEDEDEDEDSDFEFSFVQVYNDPQSRIGSNTPIYPIFSHPHPYLSPPAAVAEKPLQEKPRSVRGPLRQLFIEEEKEFGSSSSGSSSSLDELDGIPEGTYCVWTPNSKKNKDQQMQCKKSNSTGSSLRWKLRDLVVGRSRSDGSANHRFFFVPIQEDRRGEEEEVEEEAKKKSKMGGGGIGQKSFLPYKQDIVGLFANTNVNVNVNVSQRHHHFSNFSSSSSQKR